MQGQDQELPQHPINAVSNSMEAEASLQYMLVNRIDFVVRFHYTMGHPFSHDIL